MKTVDLIIPRGGKNLIERVQNDARVPVLAHLEGLCHSYIHSQADLDKAEAIILNAKLRRTGVCGATETMLVDKSIAHKALKRIGKQLYQIIIAKFLVIRHLKRSYLISHIS